MIRAIVVLLLFVSVAHAQGQQLPLTDDAWINGNSPSATFGDGNELFIHNFGPKSALVRFDAATLAGATIASASLQVMVRDLRTSGTVTIRPITSSWNENSVTWNTQPSVGASLGIIGLNANSVGKPSHWMSRHWSSNGRMGLSHLRDSCCLQTPGFGLSSGLRKAALARCCRSRRRAVPAPPAGNRPRSFQSASDHYGAGSLSNQTGTGRQTSPGGAGEAVLMVTADNVRLDLGGFRIDGQGSGIVILFEGDDFHLANGSIGLGEGTPVQGTLAADRAVIEDILVGGTRDGALFVPGNESVLRRIRAGARSGVSLGPNAVSRVQRDLLLLRLR